LEDGAVKTNILLQESPMQSTAFAPATATPSDAALIPLVVTPGFLLAAFATVPDPRRRQGTRYRLAAILALALVAILANHLSVLAIAQWGAEQSPALRRALGFPSGSTPCQSTLQRLFAQLDPDGLIAVLTRVCALTVPVPPTRGSQGVAVDGKAQRGRLAADPAAGIVHALSAFCHDYGVVLSQAPIEHAAAKAEAELTVTPEVLAAIDWRGRVLTGDALFCQRPVCQDVLRGGGDYLLLVKENQPTLFHDIQLLFEPPDSTPLTDRREVTTGEHGHGRRAETRHLIASTDLVGYLDWPGHAQVFRLERTWWEKEKQHRVVRYGITSLPPSVADAARLLAIKRAHWQIENALHRPKDVTLGEDASLIHRGHGADILAILRNLALTLLHAAGIETIAAQLRHFSSHPAAVVRFVVGFAPQNA
jgi:predicted transposase YbfD/YdcC